MYYRISDWPALLRTPLGRRQAVAGLYRYRAWPLLKGLARGYRRTLARRTRVVAVTGSFGKTTTARAISAALGRPLDPRLELNEFSYVSEAVLRIRPGQRHAVLEVGIGRPGQMAEYARAVQPDLAVVTSVGSDHNRFLKTLEITRHEKADLVRVLPPAGLAILNGDDPHVRWMADQTQARVVTFGFGEHNDLRASDYLLDWPHGARFRLEVDGERREVSSRLLGRHQVYPILAALAVVRAEGVALDQALPRLAALEPTAGRLQPVRLENGAYLLRDDFKAGVETIDAALDVLAEIPAERRLAVFGDIDEPPGSQGPIYRRLGERLARIADRAIIVGDHFRRYAAGASRAGLRRDVLVKASSARAAAEAVQADLRAGDVVLIKGRLSQRLDRVALTLAGRTVRCDIPYCRSHPTRCERCPMLERGWDGLRVVM